MCVVTSLLVVSYKCATGHTRRAGLPHWQSGTGAMMPVPAWQGGCGPDGAIVQPMKIVVAVIKPFKLDACLRALAVVPTQDLIHSEARGYGRQKDHLKDYRDDRFAVAFLPKIRLEFAVENEHLKAATEAICQVCRSGRQGDGKIWVLDARAMSAQAAMA